MMKKLGEKEKQKIRDQIDRLKQLKEPYSTAIQISFPVFITLIVLVFGIISTQADKIIQVSSYNLTLSNNLSSNLSSLQGNIIPIKSFDITSIIEVSKWFLISSAFIYVFILIMVVYSKKHKNYEDEINRLYNLLVGLKIKKRVEHSFKVKLRTFFKKVIYS